MKIEIENRFSGAVLFSISQENNTIRLTVQAAVMTDADLTPIRNDIWCVLSTAPNEVFGLIDALKNGRVDGSTYSGECACLIGTIANVRHCDVNLLRQDSSRPAERFFMGIKENDTPENNQISDLAVKWCEEWIFNNQVIVE